MHEPCRENCPCYRRAWRDILPFVGRFYGSVKDKGTGAEPTPRNGDDSQHQKDIAAGLIALGCRLGEAKERAKRVSYIKDLAEAILEGRKGMSERLP